MLGMELSMNWCRQAALENMRMLPGLKSNALVNTQLRKHVCHRRSIVFLLDTQFSDVFYHKQANEFIAKVFRQLTDDDYFGYICVGNDQSMPCPEINLEKKKQNILAKKQFMHEINTFNHFSKMRKPTGKNQTSLNQALLKAIDWQHEIPNEKVSHMSHSYDNPHKWIICLIGQDSFTLYRERVQSAAKKKVNISIIGLRSEMFTATRAKAYTQVCEDTEEGVYVNIQKKDPKSTVLEQVAITFSVYKKEKLPIIIELSDSALQK